MVLLHSGQKPLGWPAPTFSLSDPAGHKVSIEDYKYSPGLLVVFSCNHCPYAQAAWPLLVDLYKQFVTKVAIVAINSNDPEIYELDSKDGMKKMIIKEEIPFPYLIDHDQKVAESYGAVCTPEPFLFKNHGDGDFRLFYHGRIVSNWKEPNLREERGLYAAIRKLLGDQDPPMEPKAAMGCSIKWAE